MKIRVAPLLSIGALVILANWGASETTTEGSKKQAVNFSGTLVTQQGETYEVDNIALGRRYDQIPLYKKPESGAQPVADAQDDEISSVPANKYMLKADPLDGIIAKIDLSEISEIKTPASHVMWSYQKRRGSRKTDYVEIVVVSNDAEKTENSYLIDTRRKLTCDQINQAGPIELEVPFIALKRLTIKDCSYRDADKKCKKRDAKKEEPAQELSKK